VLEKLEKKNNSSKVTRQSLKKPSERPNYLILLLVFGLMKKSKHNLMSTKSSRRKKLSMLKRK